ncbi:MAG: ankyrin repeat domain-containing protein [Acidobacteria bacterium]|nr:ankyrin repeat domain-containing protein [Acidobacteriota bacterium]
MQHLLRVMLVAAPLAAQTVMPPAAKKKVDFIRDVEPILAQKCHSCHGDGVPQAGLNLKRRQNAMRGGDYGPVIQVGNSAASKLIKRVVSGDGGMQMPPTGALSEDEIGILRAWIDQGADWRLEVKEEAPPKPLDPKATALISAVRGDDVTAVTKALAANPEMAKLADNERNSLLHHATAFASTDMMKLLLDKGADVNAVNRRKSTPAHWAVHDEAKMRLLRSRGANIDTKQAEGRTPLYQAASLSNGNAVIRYLLQEGADPNAKTMAGATPLMTAASRGNVEGLKLLLAKKAEVNTQGGSGVTALMNAASSANASAVRLLLENGANPNLKMKKGDTALMDAATSGVEESVRLLLDAGAEVNARGERGYTALMYAAASDAMTAGSVKRLLDKGADATLVAEGETAKSLAVKRGDTEIARLLGATDEERKRGGVVSAKNNPPLPVSEAVGKALSLLEKQSHNFIRIGGCNSCHAQDLPSAAVGLAKDRGLPAPKAIAQLPESMRGVSAERTLDLGAFGPSSVAWELFDFGMNHVPGNAYTEASAHFIRVTQAADGHWQAPQGKRPPMSAGEQLSAAMAIYSMQNFTAPAEVKDAQKAIAKAAAWLAASNPSSTQDRAFQVMGLVWAKADAASIARTAKALAASQRADGGWSQLTHMGTDAHATGQALYALSLAGMAPNDTVYKKGTDYLLRNQAPDGSWHVKTRSIWLQPYFESGFPYGHDQWISAAGTAWASMALSAMQDSRTLSKR